MKKTEKKKYAYRLFFFQCTSVEITVTQNMEIQWKSMDHTKCRKRSHQEKESSKNRKKKLSQCN